MTIFSFRWDNVPNDIGVDEGLFMHLLVDQTHTKEKLRYVVPVEVINEMCIRDVTPGNEDWWTLRLDLKATLT